MSDGEQHARIRASSGAADTFLAHLDGVGLQALRENGTALNRYAQDLQADTALRRSLSEAITATEQAQRLHAAPAAKP